MTHLADRFAALSDRTRLDIVERLMAEGELPAGALADIAEISAPAISRHLKVLRAAGMIRQRIDGPKRLYSIAPEGLGAIAGWTLSRREFWQASLDRLEAAVEELKGED